MSVVIVFVCHNNNSIRNIIHYNHYILFVGDQEINEEYITYSKLIIARNLENNIEHEKKLLTFTAWYAISKNNLFNDYEYICVLEYDTYFMDHFENNLIHHCNLKSDFVISFFESTNKDLVNVDVDKNILQQFLLLKDEDENIVDEIELWGCSSNQCIHKIVLDNFVDWYYQDYLFIKENDIVNLSYYHERLFMVYLKSKNINYIKIDGLCHFQSRSHNGGYN